MNQDPDFYLPLTEKKRKQKQLHGDDLDALFSGANENEFDILENEDVVLDDDDGMPELEIVDEIADNELLDNCEDAMKLQTSEGDPKQDERMQNMEEEKMHQVTLEEEHKHASQ